MRPLWMPDDCPVSVIRLVKAGICTVDGWGITPDARAPGFLGYRSSGPRPGWGTGGWAVSSPVAPGGEGVGGAAR
mgnify:CR=1 FL=1